MTRLRSNACLVFAACVVVAATASVRGAVPRQVEVPRLKTSIYVGSVSLTTTTFDRSGQKYNADYTAEVFPWFFWNESGEIALNVTDDDVLRLRGGEPIEFSGDAVNNRGKPRSVTGRARPDSASGGSIKVRINADGIELVFNGRYQLVDTDTVVADRGDR